jgi:histone H3/H4
MARTKEQARKTTAKAKKAPAKTTQKKKAPAKAKKAAPKKKIDTVFPQSSIKRLVIVANKGKPQKVASDAVLEIEKILFDLMKKEISAIKKHLPEKNVTITYEQLVAHAGKKGLPKEDAEFVMQKSKDGLAKPSKDSLFLTKARFVKQLSEMVVELKTSKGFKGAFQYHIEHLVIERIKEALKVTADQKRKILQAGDFSGGVTKPRGRAASKSSGSASASRSTSKSTGRGRKAASASESESVASSAASSDASSSRSSSRASSRSTSASESESGSAKKKGGKAKAKGKGGKAKGGKAKGGKAKAAKKGGKAKAAKKGATKRNTRSKASSSASASASESE